MWSSLKQQLSAVLHGQDETKVCGFHVLWVVEGSVADKAGIESYYDFICGVDGVELNEDLEWLRAYFSNVNHPFRVAVWSLKDQKERYITLMPSQRYGLFLRWCSISIAQKTVWRVLSIENGSPAQAAGLLPYDDYIVATPEGLLHCENDLGVLIDKYMNQSLSLYVYNRSYETTRLVKLIPNRKWGGSGALGCGLGYGYFHRLPCVVRKNIQPEFTTMDTIKHEEPQDELGIPLTETEKMLGVSSNIQLTSQTKSRSRVSSRVCDDAILELMKEGEKKSEEAEKNVTHVSSKMISQETVD